MTEPEHVCVRCRGVYGEESADGAALGAALYETIHLQGARIAELEEIRADDARAEADRVAELVDLHNAEQERLRAQLATARTNLRVVSTDLAEALEEARAEVEESDRALTEVTDRLGAANAEVERLRARLATATQALEGIVRETSDHLTVNGASAALAKLGKGGA